MYKPNLYQRVKSIGYLALPVVASLYLSGCPDKVEQSPERKYTMDSAIERAVAKEAEEDKKAGKVILRIEKRDGTIEEIVVDEDRIRKCAQRDVSQKKSKQ